MSQVTWKQSREGGPARSPSKSPAPGEIALGVAWDYKSKRWQANSLAFRKQLVSSERLQGLKDEVRIIQIEVFREMEERLKRASSVGLKRKTDAEAN